MSNRRLWQITLVVTNLVVMIPGVGLGLQHGSLAMWLVVLSLATYSGVVVYLLGWKYGFEE